ncbi:facilitated trehalose transporter Tret1 isoform X2 [Eurytemora carolleeae]|uniref:facilitated trehalose transporter Tret1 isoform X2 n=1 Tax=Eurytemora carolleeae TaxID=1294199 RepID=UPI000C793535|nr:facilitated trehalose transporter Tret1 isoform X2 [Eurytemora carolleeae]|eukprot:XP_023335245.1 facilitated trehalose transporter Tret1-like isoform X2 [Eurytemora affinis]
MNALSDLIVQKSVQSLYRKVYRGCTEKCTGVVQKSVQGLYRKLYRDCTEKCTEVVQKSLQGLYRKVYRGCTEKCTGVVQKSVQGLYRKMYRRFTEKCTGVVEEIVQALYTKNNVLFLFYHVIMENKVAPAGEEGMGKPNPRNQFLAAAVVSGVATVSIGTVLGFSAILLPQLEKEVELSEDDISWIASLSNIGQLGSSIATGILSGKFGRRYTLMMLCVPLLAGWVFIGLSQGSVLYICIGRVLQGVGVMSSVTQVYLVEIADTQHRGMFGASGSVAVSLGITIVYCLGAILDWRFVCLVCGLLPIAVLVLMVPLPETPSWLILKGRREEAEKSLAWLRGGVGSNVSAEIEGLVSAQGSTSKGTGFFETLKAFRYPGAYKPFFILLTVFTLQQLTGSYAVIFYAVSLFKDIGVSSNPYLPAILTGVIRLVGTVIGTYLLKFYGRKPLMIFSSLLMAFFMGTLAATVHLKKGFYAEYCTADVNTTTNSSCSFSQEVEEDRTLYTLRAVYDIYPAIAVVLYMLTFGTGVGTIPWLLLGELCPSKVKGIASGITVFVAFITIFFVVKSFPFCILYLTPAGTYSTYGVVDSALGSLTGRYDCNLETGVSWK